jgi:hypothetical protein
MDQNQTNPTTQPAVVVPPVVNQVPAQTKSSQTSTIVTIILFLISYPIGLIVMWLWPKWSKKIKISVTLFFVLVTLVFGYLLKSIFNMYGSDFQNSLGVIGAAQECMKISDKKEQEKCIAIKVSVATVEAACQSKKIKPEDCEMARAGIKEFTTCMQTKTLDECKTMMESSLKPGNNVTPEQSEETIENPVK